jgi:DNA-binding NtrC family response regulator
MNQIECLHGTVDITDVPSQCTAHNCESFSSLVPQDGNQLITPKGLVISANDKIRGTLGETLLLSGIVPVLTTSLAESREYFAAGNPSIVVCEDLLPDGRYSELLRLNQQSDSKTPVIVVSRTGDWEDYFAALELGAHDFLAFPLLPGELQRIIRVSLAERCRQQRAQSGLILASQ